MSVETRWWHTQGNKVVCTLCPRECHIPLGSRGFCFVRANVDGKLELTTYGRSSGFCIDPIEKKPLNHFLPGTPVLSFGTAGCNLGCKFCQNWDISKSRQMDRLADSASPEAIIQAAKQSGCRSVAFTYNDPVIWAEYAIEIAKVARQEGIKTVAVTAGYITPKARAEFYQWMDAANVDLKAFTESFYRKLTQTHLEPVLDTLRYLKHETDVWFEITTLLIPGENDDPQETRQMCDWIVNHLGDDVPVHFTAFHPDFKMMDKPGTPHETLIAARQIARNCGIKYAYVGNVHDLKRQNTYCPGCGQMLIERNWYELGRYDLAGDHCLHCDQKIPGIFEMTPGNWGRKRVPVTIDNASGDQVTVTARAPNQRIVPPQITGTAPSADICSSMAQGSSKVTTGRPTVLLIPAEPPKIDFDTGQVQAILTYTRSLVEATVRRITPDVRLPEQIAEAPAYGCFLSLRRGRRLRACRGHWGGDHAYALGNLLSTVAADTARLDQRFPTVTPDELSYLDMDISLIHAPKVMTEIGEDRVRGLEIGKHGLIVCHPRGQALLLPHAATQSNWDAKTFLDGACQEAGLPEDTWRRDSNATIMTFQTRLLDSQCPKRELDPMKFNGYRMQELIMAANRLLADQQVGEVDRILADTHAEELGLWMQTEAGLNSTAIGIGQSLLELVHAGVKSFKDLAVQKRCRIGPIRRLVLLHQPILLQADDYPGRHQGLTDHAVLGRHNGRWSIVIPGSDSRTDRVAAVLSDLGVSQEQWKMSGKFRLTAFDPVIFQARQRPNGNGTTIRPPASAGQFYPRQTDAMHQAVDHYLAIGRKAAAERNATDRRAIMLPHAGWTFCGEIIAKTLALSHVPDTVIIIGPKHTPYGESWSVAPHTSWNIPGTSVPIASELAERLHKDEPRLVPEAEAHRLEHGSEVLIPFLHRLNSNVRVLPIAVGQTTYEETAGLAQALAHLWDQAQDKLLLVISSDMNHFAPEAENRRLDHMAIDAMRTGDPRVLYQTCVEHKISMCGFIPACIIMQTLRRQSSALEPELVDYCNSGKTSGDMSRVVGYAGMLLD